MAIIMHSAPGRQSELEKITTSRRKLRLIREKTRLIITTENTSGGFSSSEVVPFKSKEEEELFVLEREKKNTKRNIEYIYLKFATRTITYCMYKGKKVQIEDATVYEAPYIFDGQAGPNNEIHIVPAKNLSKLINLSKFSKSLTKEAKRNPEKMCLLYYYRGSILWLKDGYVKVSELKEKINKQTGK